jgi:hypothetical protein
VIARGQHEEDDTMRICFTLLVAILLAAPAVAGPPTAGIYRSTDMGGLMLTGRFSESWVAPGTHGQIGNTINAASWDGAALGTQWVLSCPHIGTSPVLVSNTVDGLGDGEVVYSTTYAGGTTWLSRTGPWGDNSVDYLGTLDNFIATTTFMYSGGELLGIRSNVTTIGHLNDFAQCFEYTISNATFEGPLASEPKPANYPDFIDAACATGVLDRGGWGTTTHIALRVSGCRIPVAPTTWTAAKALYR